MSLKYRLQNSPLTGWLFKYWRSKLTGEIKITPFWCCPGNEFVEADYR